MKKIKVVAVSYLNTKPFLYGLFKSAVSELIDLQLAIPSECARMLRDGQADLGLVPVAVIPELDAPRLVSHYCIGAERSVRTVAIFSEKPIEELDRIYLDYHSRTSVELAKILIRDYWHLQPELLPAYPGFEDRLGGTTGGLIIGIAEETATFTWLSDEPLISPSYKSAVAFFIMVALLLFRPQGLFKGRLL